MPDTFSDDVNRSPSERARDYWRSSSDNADAIRRSVRVRQFWASLSEAVDYGVAHSVEQKLNAAAQNPGQPISFTPQELSTLRSFYAQGQAVERLNESQVHEDIRTADAVRRQTRMKP